VTGEKFYEALPYKTRCAQNARTPFFQGAAGHGAFRLLRRAALIAIL
jgi:hypothetical protein